MGLLFPDSLGVDITRHQLSLVYLQESIKGVKLAGRAAYPLDAHRPVSEQLEDIGKHIRQFIDQHHISTTSICMGIPAEMAIQREIEFPLAVKENLGQTIRYELEKYIPLPEDEVYVDFQATKEDRKNNRLKVFLVASRRKDIAMLVELAKQIKTGVSSIEPTPTATINYLGYATDLVADGRYGLVEVQQSHVQLSLVDDQRLQLTRTLPFTASEDTAALIAKNLEPWLVNSQSPLPVFCYGQDADPDLTQRFPGSETVSLQPLAAERSQAQDWRLMSAFGLALKGLKKVPMQVNLLPDAQRKKPSRLNRYLTLMLAGLVLLTAILWTGSQLLRQHSMHRRLDSEISRLESEIADIQRSQARTDELQAQIEYLNTIKHGGVPMLEVLKELTTIIPDTAWVREVRLSQDEVMLDGYADSASQLIPLLDASPRFTDVAFLSAITKGRDGKEKFRIGFKIKTP